MKYDVGDEIIYFGSADNWWGKTGKIVKIDSINSCYVKLNGIATNKLMHNYRFYNITKQYAPMEFYNKINVAIEVINLLLKSGAKINKQGKFGVK
jgi:hypothetical protein